MSSSAGKAPIIAGHAIVVVQIDGQNISGITFSGVTATELREGDNFLEVKHLETVPVGTPSAGDLRLRVCVCSDGFSGLSECVWTDAGSFQRFLTALRQLDVRRQGTARLEAIGSPDECWLEIRAVDRAGHLAVCGRVSRWQFPSHRPEGFHQCVEFRFEFCPSQLPAVLAGFEKIVPVPAELDKAGKG